MQEFYYESEFTGSVKAGTATGLSLYRIDLNFHVDKWPTLDPTHYVTMAIKNDTIIKDSTSQL